MKKWLEPDLSGSKVNKVAYTLIAFLALFVWTKVIFSLFLPAMTGAVAYQYVNMNGFIPTIGTVTYYEIFESTAWAATWETLAFIALPIAVAKRFDDKLVWPVIGISSLLFGWGHAVISPHIGLMVQGVMGVIFSWVYIRNNYSFASAAIVHCAWNGMWELLTYLDRT